MRCAGDEEAVIETQATTILYTLSTLAQTCAALAAFVGAVGLYRLQALSAEHARIEQQIRSLLAEGPLHRDVAGTYPLGATIATARDVIDGTRQTSPEIIDSLWDAMSAWDAYPSRHQRAGRALRAFEAWNLLVIGAALVGFNYVPALAASAWALPLLWPVAVVTVGLTAYCVFVWTKA